MKISVLGEGAWGTAIAKLLAHNGYSVTLWCYDGAVCETIEKKRVNERYLPGVILSDRITPTIDMQRAVESVDLIFEAIPVKFLSNVLRSAAPYYSNQQYWIVLSKGIEQGSLQLPTEIVDAVFHDTVHKAVVVGPSFAHELANEQMTALMIASENRVVAKQIQKVMEASYCKTFISDDVCGVQLCAALKNVMALCIGMIDGAQFGENARAYIFTRGLQEIVELCVAYGGSIDTAYGLAGIGDLVLTAMSNASKNHKVGVLLGQGLPLEDIIQRFGAVPEGINTSQSIHELAQRKNMNMPILNGIYRMLFEKLPLQVFLQQSLK